MLVLLHVIIIALSNLLVQYPFELFGYTTTYGAFTYPFIFILSDLATRLYGLKEARKIVFQAMLPGLLTSFLFALMIYKNISMMWMIGRISTACFLAYVTGQLFDIYIFSRFRNNRRWYIAPLVSGTLSNSLDTFLFFFLAFYHSNNKYMSAHWTEVATMDLVFKCLISVIAFVPLYGLLLNLLSSNKIKSFSLLGHKHHGADSLTSNQQ